MIKATTPTSQNKAQIRLVRWLAAALAAAGDGLHAEGDLTALEHGWQIIPRQAGLGRRYRDPRFDALARCEAPAGTPPGAGPHPPPPGLPEPHAPGLPGGAMDRGGGERHGRVAAAAAP